MRILWVGQIALLMLLMVPTLAGYAKAQDCNVSGIDPKSSVLLGTMKLPSDRECVGRMSHGFPIPDPNCTPGAINPTITLLVLKNPHFRTGCIRDKATSADKKKQTYDWYGTQHPKNNIGRNQTCELDHLVSLELGGADTLANIWPQCGPSGVPLIERFFKEKDLVENYLANQVRQGKVLLRDAQKGIAEDWTQYLDDARAACAAGHCTTGAD